MEQQFGGRREYAQLMQAKRIAQIEASERLSSSSAGGCTPLFGRGSADFLDEPPKLTHSDFSHAHLPRTGNRYGQGG